MRRAAILIAVSLAARLAACIPEPCAEDSDCNAGPGGTCVADPINGTSECHYPIK